MKRNMTRLALLILALIGLFSTRLYANDLARSNCIFDTVEAVFPEFFSPRNTATQTVPLDEGGVAYVRSYSNESQSGLFATDTGEVWYAFYGQWNYYGTIDQADQAIANGACQSSGQSSPTSVGFCATPPLGYISDGKPLTSHGVVSTDLLWPNGNTVKVAFDFQGRNSGKRFYGNKPYMCQSAVSQTDCETRIKNEVAKLANTWSQDGNIHFQFGVPWNEGEIRIRFRDTNGGGNSYLGIQALGIAKDEETMNFGLNENTKPDTFKRTVIHEFGHAIGFQHEHQSPAVHYTWNTEQLVQDVLRQNPSWDRDTVIQNIITPLNSNISKAPLYVTEFDPHSIMIYQIPSDWVSAADKANKSSCPSTDPNWCVELNRELSDLDKRTVAQVYPFSNVTSCSYTISPTTQSFSATGGTGTATVTTQTGCQWNASSNSGWIRVTSGSSGNGNGTVGYSVSPHNNTSSASLISSGPRTGTITIAGKTLTVTQFFEVATLPTAPQNMFATALSNNSIQVSWTDSSNNETGFYIYRWTGSAWYRLNTVGANTTSYTDTGLQGGIAYNYYIAAYNSSGENNEDSYVSATTTAVVATIPTAPQSMFATALSSSSVQVSWTDSSNNETGFSIYRWYGNAWYKIATVGANTTYYTDTGLQGGTTYHYLVAAYNSAGENGYSNYVSATTMSQSYLESLVD